MRNLLPEAEFIGRKIAVTFSLFRREIDVYAVRQIGKAFIPMHRFARYLSGKYIFQQNVTIALEIIFRCKLSPLHSHFSSRKSSISIALISLFQRRVARADKSGIRIRFPRDSPPVVDSPDSRIAFEWRVSPDRR